MAKRKSKSTIMVADGFGGMAQVQDRRFEQCNWPIRFDVPKEQADAWLQYLSAECARRGWNCASLTQLETKENSGSINVNTGCAGKPQLAVVWERSRDGPIKVKARSAGTPDFPVDQANEFFQRVNERSGAGATERFHRAWHLCYEGLPWLGELWLDDTVRLGPPSRQDQKGLIGPRIISVSALINGIDLSHAASTFTVNLRELSVFLSVVMGTAVRASPISDRGWSWTDSSGQIECDVRNSGYWETNWPREMPTRGQIQQVPLKEVQRPDLSEKGIDGSQSELELPDDIVKLWRAFRGLPPDQHRQFLQVGALWQLALALDREYETTRFALMVAACEALKPGDHKYWRHHSGHVIASLLGNETANRFKKFQPQDVRGQHLHRGEFRGSEFAPRIMMSSFEDPSFDEGSRELYTITQNAIIEWLRRDGVFAMPPLKRRKWIKKRALGLLVTILSLVLGIGVGWLLRKYCAG